MQRKRVIQRKAKNLLNRVIGLFVIFCITLVCLVTTFIFLKQQHRILLNPLSNSIATNQFVTTQKSTDTIAQLLEKNNIETQSISVGSDSSILATLKTGQVVIFSDNKSQAEQIASLQLIKARLTIEGKRFNRIDFRFDNPVITF